jgi:uncharacterized protein (TIRG00374 family)
MRGRPTPRRLVPLVGGLLVVVATFAFVLPKIADYRDVWDVVRELGWREIGVLLAVTVLNVVTFAPPWQVAVPGLGFLPALAMTQASAALSLVFPGGGAVGMATAYGILRAWGFPRRVVSRAVTLTGIWNQGANLAYPILAVFLLAVAGQPTAALAGAAFVGVAVLGFAVTGLVLVLASNRLARDVGDAAAQGVSWLLARLRRRPVRWGGKSIEQFRRDAVDLLRRRWHLLTITSLAGSLCVFLVLLVALRVLDVPGSEVSVIEAFAAWALVRLIGAFPITPGGIGVVELALSGVLIGFGGNNAGVVAATLVYRFLTVVPSLALGLVAAATWRRHHAAEGRILPPA